jgi:preprotein translocase subunit SecY
MSEEGDTFFVNLAEKSLGLVLIVIGAIMLYFTATSTSASQLGAFSVFFGILAVIMLVIGLFLLLVRAPE